MWYDTYVKRLNILEKYVIVMIYSTYAATFRCFGHGCGDSVSIDNIQKEISWVVVWFTEIASNVDQNEYWVFHIH